MNHVGPAHLAELALGNDASNDDVSALRHIDACIRCERELNRMTRVVAAARSVEERDLPTAHPEQVWRRITQELSLAGEAAPPPVGVGRLRRALPARGHRAGFSGNVPTRTATRLVLGVSLTVAVIWWSRRPRAAKRPGRNRRRSQRTDGTRGAARSVRHRGCYGWLRAWSAA